jgi:hypothetical protein
MRRALFSIGIALALATGLPALANAQKAGGHGGGGGGVSAGGGGGGGGAHVGGGGFSAGGGGAPRMGGGGGAAFAPSAPSAGAFARAPSGAYATAPKTGPRVIEGGVTPGGQRFVQGGGGNWHGVHRRHGRFFVGPGVGFYADGPYEDYAYATDDCYQLRLIRGVWRQVYLCGDNY